MTRSIQGLTRSQGADKVKLRDHEVKLRKPFVKLRKLLVRLVDHKAK